MLLLGLALALARKHRRLAWTLVVTTSALLWLLSSHAASYGLGRWLLPSYPAVSASDLKRAQAIVVLGAGVNLYAPEYGAPTMGGHATARLQYGAHLKRQTGLPMLFAAGKAGAPPRRKPSVRPKSLPLCCKETRVWPLNGWINLPETRVKTPSKPSKFWPRSTKPRFYWSPTTGTWPAVSSSLKKQDSP